MIQFYHYRPSHRDHYFNALLPRGTGTLWPELIQPLIWVFRSVLVQDLALVVGKVVAGKVVQRVLLIRACTNSVWNGLNVVSNLLVDPALDISDLCVLDSVLITVVG
jgi:hypothetical protein